jgi:hypothetical protein
VAYRNPCLRGTSKECRLRREIELVKYYTHDWRKYVVMKALGIRVNI